VTPTAAAWMPVISCLALATVCFGQTDFDIALVGTWEYRQAAGKSVDAEGERLEVAEAEKEKSRSSGFTRDEMAFEGLVQGRRLTLRCTSRSASCPDLVMIFRKGGWTQERRQ
jgi:hypothetical protein